MPIDVTLSGITIEVNELHSANAPPSTEYAVRQIDVTLFGITIEVNELQN